MERVTRYVKRFHLGFADLLALCVGVRLRRGFDPQPRFGGRRSNQLDDCHPIGERPGAPVLGDMAEEAVLYFVPLGSPRWIVAHRDCEVRLVGELLQFELPQPDARAVRALLSAGRGPNLA